MHKFLTLTSTTALLLSAFLITGCSSSDSDDDNNTGDSGGDSTTVPANAVIIDSSNAEEIVLATSSMVNTFEEVGTAFAVQVTPAIGLKSALDIVKPLIKNRSNKTGIDLATGAVFNESGACSGGGTFSFTGNETDDGITYAESGTSIFNNCSELGFTINGSLSFSFTENSATGDYSDDTTGTLSMILTGQETVTLSMSGIDFKETGNTFTGTYTNTALSFALDFISNGSGSGGFAVKLLAPIVESNGDDCPDSGHFLITGGNSTTAEGIFSDGSSITVKANGTVVTSISCT